MKKGDLVRFKPGQRRGSPQIGIILQTGWYLGRRDVRVYWASLNKITEEIKAYLEVISESR